MTHKIKSVLIKPSLLYHYLAFRFFGVSHTCYKPCIILSQSRAGSTLLKSLLSSNPHLDIQGEVIRKLEGRDTRKFLQDFFSEPKPRYVAYSGFKLFYYHPLDGDPKQLQLFVKELENVRMIHLKRKNLLRIAVSRKIALQTGKWRRLSDKPKVNLPKSIAEFTVDELKSEFQKMGKWESDSEQFFSSVPLLPVYYEDLVENREEVVREICSFLEIDYFMTGTKLLKQNPEPLNKLIGNYSGLKHSFRNSEWISFFE